MQAAGSGEKEDQQKTAISLNISGLEAVDVFYSMQLNQADIWRILYTLKEWNIWQVQYKFHLRRQTERSVLWRVPNRTEANDLNLQQWTVNRLL